MKLNNKKIKGLSVASAITLMASNVFPFFSCISTYAESTTKDSIGSINMEDDGITIGIDETQDQTTTYSDELENESIQSADVYVSQASTFGVTIPKTIILDGKKNENGINKANYIVTINGNIAGEEKIKVIPDSNFIMSQEGKNDINVSVVQDKEEWKYNELDVLGNGEVSANGMTAGMWRGQFNFFISLGDLSITGFIVDENNKDLNGKLLKIDEEQKDILLTKLEEDGIANKTNIDAIVNVNADDFDGVATATFNVLAIAKPGDVIAIYHYDETNQVWEYITTTIVDENGQINATFNSFSPIAFNVIKQDHTHIDEDIDSICDVCSLKGEIINIYSHTHSESCYKINSKTCNQKMSLSGYQNGTYTYKCSICETKYTSSSYITKYCTRPIDIFVLSCKTSNTEIYNQYTIFHKDENNDSYCDFCNLNGTIIVDYHTHSLDCHKTTKCGASISNNTNYYCSRCGLYLLFDATYSKCDQTVYCKNYFNCKKTQDTIDNKYTLFHKDDDKNGICDICFVEGNIINSNTENQYTDFGKPN